jgi:hypothetical protein
LKAVSIFGVGLAYPLFFPRENHDCEEGAQFLFTPEVTEGTLDA